MMEPSGHFPTASALLEIFLKAESLVVAGVLLSQYVTPSSRKIKINRSVLREGLED